MIYTEVEKRFWKYHSMGCGFTGEFKQKTRYPEDPIIFECPECGSEYRPEQELNGEHLDFAGDSIDMFSRATDNELIEELENRGYQVKKKSEKAQFTANLQQAFEEYLRDPTDRNLGRYEGIAKVAGFMDLTNREVLTAEEEVHRKLEKERQA